ncbi:MAG TPA: hypothetical protein VFI63_03520 [Solirubrobacterales bacterium]|nr:hypothetical protein [Solirubrobacterales bacterium]
MKTLRDRLTYANVTATLALFVALGGSSYAALKISGRDIAAHTITGRNVKANSIGGRQIKESSLGAVPRAREAALLDGVGAERFLVRCPEGMIPVADVCVETQSRPPAPYSSAVLQCAASDNKSAPGRRLPTHQELMSALTYEQIQLASGGELTSEVYPSTSTPGEVEVLYITNKVGNVGLTPDTDAGAKAYRCVADPLN